MATKKAVNLSIDETLLARARIEGVNLSASLERSLRVDVANLETERWKRDNAQAIRESNEDIEKNGLWNEDYRIW